jgi:hypothetical protein
MNIYRKIEYEIELNKTKPESLFNVMVFAVQTCKIFIKLNEIVTFFTDYPSHSH